MNGAAPPPAYVVGSGIAGLRFALYLAEHRDVVIVTKKAAVESNTNYAQGGIAAAVGADDSVELHYEDTMRAGCGLPDPAVVRFVVSEGPALVRELMTMGAAFAKENGGALELGREGGHSRNRVIHSADATGREIERVLLTAAERHPRIHLRPYHFAVDVVVGDGGVEGLVLLEPEGRLRVVPASLVCLSTGGVGRIFRYTTNPEIATGDGLAMGYRAGAVLRDLEFIQFHPTALARPGSGAFLISEAVRGEGGLLRTIDGERFMSRYDPERMELAPRDVVARAIDTELKRRGDPHVLLDVTHLKSDHIKARFPTIYSTCLLHGIAMDRDPIPVVPAAHYSCGGLKTDEMARTSVRGLYAVGETASHGLHGANRLASNSLLEALVFARRGARAAAEEPSAPPRVSEKIVEPGGRPECGLTELYCDRLRAVMSQHVGIFRTPEALMKAGVEVSAILTGLRRLLKVFRPTRELLELANMVQCGELITRGALLRKSSLGLHALEGAESITEVKLTHTEICNPDPHPLLRDQL